LWIPSVRDFISVDEIPITGTGKVDLRRIREIAQAERGA
jgi:acyl-[acyl-carrier-protein]-phospholipid O-acyltransferase/long-chain-fatty-acid--[acyl-carrier-protein] ligase